ncbi:MAG: hypothetical protein IKS43_07525 [Clostridia bacterium]|nr:hypothetical protein [Clostridia bacterium]
MCRPEKDRRAVCGFNRKELYSGLLGAEGSENGMLARECVGRSDGCFYRFPVSPAEAEDQSFIARFDTVSRRADVLWRG